MKRLPASAAKGFLLLELALALVVIGALVALLMPLLALQGQLDSAQRDSLSMKQARDALLRQSVVGLGLPAPLQLAEGDAGGGTTASSHVDLATPLKALDLGWAGALPGALLGVPSVSPLQTAYWYDVQPALRADAASAFYPATALTETTWGFRPITDQFDPDINPKMSTGGVRTQLCRNLNTLQALEQNIRKYPANTATDYTRSHINVTLPRVWATGYESHFAWDSTLGWATSTEPTVDAVFENSSAAAFVVMRRQPPALRRLDRQNGVYTQAGTTGLDQPLAQRGAIYPPEATSGARGFRVYENPLTAPVDNPVSDTSDYDGRVQAVSLSELADTLRQGGLCTAPAEACMANQLYVRFGNYVNSAPVSGSPQGLTLRWELMDHDASRVDDVLVQSGEVASGSMGSGQCLDAFATDVASKPNTRYLRVSFKTPAGVIGYSDSNPLGYWFRGGKLVDPAATSPLPAADDGLNRWRNLQALSAAEAGKTVTVNCTGSHTLSADGQLSRNGPALPTCAVTQLP